MFLLNEFLQLGGKRELPKIQKMSPSHHIIRKINKNG
jgi:hypothetical protein